MNLLKRIAQNLQGEDVDFPIPPDYPARVESALSAAGWEHPITRSKIDEGWALSLGGGLVLHVLDPTDQGYQRFRLYRELGYDTVQLAHSNDLHTIIEAAEFRRDAKFFVFGFRGRQMGARSRVHAVISENEAVPSYVRYPECGVDFGYHPESGIFTGDPISCPKCIKLMEATEKRFNTLLQHQV